MSAYIVSKEIINEIVTTAINLGVITEDLADNLGQMLWEENYSSVNFRYRENEVCEVYKYDNLSTSDEVKNFTCAMELYSYQSCEHKGWMMSASRFLIESLK